jgi:hypothetical protein
MNVTTASTAPTFTDNLVSQAASKIQERGMDVIQKTMANDKLDDGSKAELVKAQMEAFGVTQTMLDKAKPATETAAAATVTATTAATTAPATNGKLQERGMDIIQKVMDNNKLDSDTKAKMVEAQMQAFGVTQEMIDKKTQTTTKATQAPETPSIEATDKQKSGMESLLKDLASNADNTTKKGLLTKDIQDYGLSKDMVNQVVEQFSQGDQEKYIQSKFLLGANMGFKAFG